MNRLTRFLSLGVFLFLSLPAIASPKQSSSLKTVMLSVNPGDPGQINLSWTSINPTFWYQIQKSYNGINFFNIANATPGTTVFTNGGLYYKVRYWYRIIAHNPDGSIADFSNIPSTLSPASLPPLIPLFQDAFDARIISSAWSFVGGNWRQKAGLLEQIDHATPIDTKKAILVDQKYPKDQTITAKLRVTGWAGFDQHVGVGVNLDPKTGFGYELVFRDSPGSTAKSTVQFIRQDANGVTPGNAFTFPWKKGTWYWFKLMGPINNVLSGKVWEDGTSEPNTWLFTKTINGNVAGGSPGLDGGMASTNGSVSAVFDEVTVTSPTAVGPKPFAIGGDPSVNPANFRITTFATGLNFPHSMQQLRDKSILVSTSDPVSGGNYFASTGTLLRFVDANGDGVADGPGEIKYSGLPGTLTALQVAGNLVFVTSSQEQKESIWVLRMGARPRDPYTLVGAIHFSFPTTNWDHTTYASAVRRTPKGGSGDYELFFGVGSEFNAAPDSAMVTLSGLISGVAHSASIYSVKIHDTGSVVNVTDLTQIADGLRNPAGITFDPTTGDLYFEDNGMDIPSNQDEQISVDKIHRIPFAQIGTQVFNFGFPQSYIAYRTGLHVGPATIDPIVAFQPWPDPFAGAESEGPSEIAIAPKGFPSGLNNGIFVGFHGRFTFGGIKNEENPLVFYNRIHGKYFHFISNKEPDVGHLDGLLSTYNALFVSDLCKNGDPFSSAAAGTGVIYKIEAV